MCSSLARRALSSDARVLRDVALRRSAARSFDASRTVPDAVLADVLAVAQVRRCLPSRPPRQRRDPAQRAPSSFNLQPWTCVVVRSLEQRELMGRASARARVGRARRDPRGAGAMLSESNKRRVLEAPVTAVFCADLGAPARAHASRAARRPAYPRAQSRRGRSRASPRRSAPRAATAPASRT